MVRMLNRAMYNAQRAKEAMRKKVERENKRVQAKIERERKQREKEQEKARKARAKEIQRASRQRAKEQEEARKAKAKELKHRAKYASTATSTTKNHQPETAAQKRKRKTNWLNSVKDTQMRWESSHMCMIPAQSELDVLIELEQCILEKEGKSCKKMFNATKPSRKNLQERLSYEADEIFHISEKQNELTTLNSKLSSFEDIQEPKKEEVYAMLETQAKEKIHTIFFWKRSKLIHEYIEKEYVALLKAWKDNVQYKADICRSIAKCEDEIKELIAQKEDYIISRRIEIMNEWEKGEPDFYEQKLRELNTRLNCIDSNIILPQIGAIKDHLQMPYDYSYSYDYDMEKSVVMIKLNLPDPSKLPLFYWDGSEVSLRNSIERELAYFRAVRSLVVRITNEVYKISLAIKNVIIAGYISDSETKVFLCFIDLERNLFFDSEFHKNNNIDFKKIKSSFASKFLTPNDFDISVPLMEPKYEKYKAFFLD